MAFARKKREEEARIDCLFTPGARGSHVSLLKANAIDEQLAHTFVNGFQKLDLPLTDPSRHISIKKALDGLIPTQISRRSKPLLRS